MPEKALRGVYQPSFFLGVILCLKIISSKSSSDISQAEYTEQFFQKKDIKETFALSFKENIKATIRTTLEVQIPFTVSEKTELGLEAGFEAGQTTTTERLTSIEIRKEVKVPPHSSVQLESYVEFVNDLKLPFTATATIKAAVDRLTKNNDTARAKVNNPNSVKHFLTDSGFKIKKVTGVNGNAVLATFKGTFTGSYGIASYTTLKDPHDTASSTSESKAPATTVKKGNK